MATDWETCPVVERDPGKLGGALIFRNSRMPVATVFENLKQGATIEEILAWYPGITREKVEAVIDHETREMRSPVLKELELESYCLIRERPNADERLIHEHRPVRGSARSRFGTNARRAIGETPDEPPWAPLGQPFSAIRSEVDALCGLIPKRRCRHKLHKLLERESSAGDNRHLSNTHVVAKSIATSHRQESA